MTIDSSTHSLIANQTALLAPDVYDSVSLGLAGARSRMRGIEVRKYPAQFSGLVRMEAREDLEARALAPGWTVAGDPRQMAQLLLVNDEHKMVLRFLKENRANKNRVPHAGSNRARRDVWSSRDTPFDFVLDESKLLDEDEYMTCLLLWGPVDPADLDLGFTLRVVHTIEAGNHRTGVVCDLEIELLQGGNIYDHLEFAGADEGGDLFEVEIAEENGEE